MNIYSYFREPEQNLNVPSKNEPLWNWITAQVKIWNDPYDQQVKFLQKYHSLLQDDEHLNEKQIKEEVLHSLKKNVWTWTFWKQEFSDLFSFLFVYWVCIEQLWPYVVVRFFEHKPMFSTLSLTLGEVIKVVVVYIIYKLVLDFMAQKKRRDKLSFWLPFIGLFLLYLGAIFCANQLQGVILFHYSLLVVVIITGIFFCFEWDRERKVGK
ncbi:hypothetical protein C815_00742 [Firmicutes bacterium M10-2]|nr:hypothetical protein C815_00742 [Firmicutes bacterium M10-2]